MTKLWTDSDLSEWLDRLEPADVASSTGNASVRQAVHVVYGGAHRFSPDIMAKLGRLALASLDAYAPDATTFFGALGLRPAAPEDLYQRVRHKLETVPVDDYRIDFEDGYGARADEEEDHHARAAGMAVAEGCRHRALPPALGIRIKRLDTATGRRGLRTLGLFFEGLGDTPPPTPFVVTVPKVVRPAAVAVLGEALTRVEQQRGWATGQIGIEIMVEDPRLWFDADGFAVGRVIDAADGRLRAVHLGPYDYTASIGVAAADQRLLHPMLDVARHLLQIGFAGTTIRLGDGPTMLMPIPPRRAEPNQSLSAAAHEENVRTVHRAWRNHADAVRASMERGFDLGWDLHPAQIPARLGAIYASFHAQLPSVAKRLRNFVDAAGQATRVGAVFDDAATGQGLVNFCLRAIATGAVGEDEIVEQTGLDRALLATRSFATIVQRSAAKEHG